MVFCPTKIDNNDKMDIVKHNKRSKNNGVLYT
jgi:hypothetical protein